MKSRYLLLAIMLAAGAVNAAETISADDLLSILPQSRRILTRKVPAGNPFRRAVNGQTSLQSPAESAAQTLEERIRAAIGGKNIGGVILGSKQVEPQVIIKQMVFSRNDELQVPDGEGGLMPIMVGARIRITDITRTGLRLEVSAASSSQGVPTAQEIIVPFDDFFRMEDGSNNK